MSIFRCPLIVGLTIIQTSISLIRRWLGKQNVYVSRNVKVYAVGWIMNTLGHQTTSTQINKSSFLKTDFRHQKWVNDRKALHQKAKRSSFHVQFGRQPKGRGGISVDTCKARSTDVLRMCLKDLGWREVMYSLSLKWFCTDNKYC